MAGQTREQFAQNWPGITDELGILTKTILDTMPVERIYLFGSYAYGTPHKDSDLDLYIVFRDDLPVRELEALTALRSAIDPVQKMPLDLLGLRKKRFLDRATGMSTIEKEVAQKGVKLYG
jgi:predicted nucleotidyltransferase